MSKYGEVLDTNTVRFERLLPGPIERVWRYLVEADRRAQWLCGGETELAVGGHVVMHFHNSTLSSQPDIDPPAKHSHLPEEMFFSGTVTRCEPPTLLAHTWDFENSSSEVCYELEAIGEQVRLVLTHTRLHDRDELQDVCGGWHTHLDILADVLQGIEPQPFWKVHTRLEAEYDVRLRPEA